jgi:magnesium-transporting ATPase (P-type)
MQLSKVARCVITDSAALLLTVLISVFATFHSHIPAALTLIQLVVIELLIMAWPIAYFSRQKGSHKAASDAISVALMEITVFAVLAASLAYGNYLLFYSRHTIDPAYMDPANPLHAHATTITLTTLALFELMNVKLVALEGKKHIFKKISIEKELIQRLTVAFAILLAVIYFPLCHTIFGTRPLTLWDWLVTLLCALVYGGFRLLQRHTKAHSRQAVIKLHKEVHSRGK